MIHKLFAWLNREAQHDPRTPNQCEHAGYERAMRMIERVNGINHDCFWVVFWTTVDEDEPRYEMDSGLTDHYEMFDNEIEATERYEGLLLSELEEVRCAGVAPVKSGSEPHWVGGDA